MNWSNLEQFGNKRPSAIAAIAVIFGLSVKLILVFSVIPYLTATSPSTYQADKFPDWYDLIAMNIVNGNGYKVFPETAETMLRTPGWVIVLAGIFSVFGYSLAATKALNILFSITTVYLAYVLGRQVTKSNRLGLVAAALTFLHPAILIADSRGGVESLVALSIIVFMLLIYRALAADAIKNYLLAGLAFGVILVIKPSAGLFPAFLFLYLLGLKPSLSRLRHSAVRVGALVLVSGAMLTPWIVRNYVISGQFVPTMSAAGAAAFQGFYVVSHAATGKEHYILVDEASAEQEVIAKGMGLEFRPGFYPQFYASSDEIKYYDHLGNLVKQRYWEEPSSFLRAIVFNSIGFWIQGRTATATKLNMILVLPFLALVIWGTYAGFQQSLRVEPILLFVGAFFLVHLPFVGLARYHVPLIPLLAILACIPLRSLIEDVPGRVEQVPKTRSAL